MIPVHGQEALSFSWSAKFESSKAEGRFRGKAVQRFQKIGASQVDRETALLKRVWPELENSVSLFFASLKNFESFCAPVSSAQSVCRTSSVQSFGWSFLEAEAVMKAQLSDQMEMEIRLHDMNEDGLRRFELFIYERPKGPQSRPVMGLELFANRCELS